MEKQCTSHIFMVRPVSFGFNEETAESNAFMQAAVSDKDAQRDALVRFDAFVAKLRAAKISVTVFEDSFTPRTPDSIFPNNWISLHSNGSAVLYPMEAESRRQERRMDILERLMEDFFIGEIIDLSPFEAESKYLEGTGSLVLDRSEKIAYACLASRTSSEVLKAWQKHFPLYKVVDFHASDQHNVPIYHTNVMMCIGENFSIVCAETIHDRSQKKVVLGSLKASGKEPLEISLEQMSEFAGNMLQVRNALDELVLIMSSRAYRSLNQEQLDFLRSKTKILHAELGCIETLGGGSARCMIAEIHLPKK